MYGRANVIPSPHITTSPGVATARFAEGHEAIHCHKYFIVQTVDLHPCHEKYLAEEYGFSPCDIALSFAGIILTAPNGHILYTVKKNLHFRIAQHCFLHEIKQRY